MGQTLCVWFPDWPLRRDDAPQDEPCLVVATGVGGQRVVARNRPAAEAGVVSGMLRREAEALCPTGVILERDPAAEAAGFEPVVTAIESVVPAVEVAEPGLAFLPVSGAIRYYGGARPLVDQLLSAVEAAAGSGARIGLAGGPFAARWAAATAGEGEPVLVDDESAFLARLDIAALGDEDLVATFRWLGVTTLGALQRLPRGAVASRFGQAGVEAHRLASGEDRVPTPRRPPPELAVEGRYEEPLRLLDQVGFAARALAHQLVARLHPVGLASHLLEVEAEAGDGQVRNRVWRSADPFTEAALAERVWWQLRAWTESGGVPGGIVRLRLAPGDLSGEGRQLTLLEDVTARVEAERALARAQALLGPDAVLRAGPQGGRMPDERIRWHRWGEEAPAALRDPEAPWPGATPSPSPSLVPDEEHLLEVEWDDGMPIRVRLGSRWESVLSWSGPWRLSGRWWQGEPTSDRYQIVTSLGALLCRVTEGRTFLAGIYD